MQTVIISRVFSDYDLEKMGTALFPKETSKPFRLFFVKIFILNTVFKNTPVYTKEEILKALYDLIESIPRATDPALQKALGTLSSHENYAFEETELKDLCKKMWDKLLWESRPKFLKEYDQFTVQIRKGECFYFFPTDIIIEVLEEKAVEQIELLCQFFDITQDLEVWKSSEYLLSKIREKDECPEVFALLRKLHIEMTEIKIRAALEFHKDDALLKYMFFIGSNLEENALFDSTTDGRKSFNTQTALLKTLALEHAKELSNLDIILRRKEYLDKRKEDGYDFPEARAILNTKLLELTKK